MILNQIRQWFVPKYFRLPIIDDNSDEVLGILRTLENLLREKILTGQNDNLTGSISSDSTQTLDLLSDILINIWRVQQKLKPHGEQEISEELRRVYRPIQSIFDSLTQAGFDIVDRTSQRYDIGLNEIVLANEKVDGIQFPVIIETIKPSILYQGKLVHKGEIIVGVPKA